MDQDRERFLDETCAFWQPLSPRPLSREDARQINENLAGFFTVLAEWKRRRQQRAAAQEAQSPATEAARSA